MIKENVVILGASDKSDRYSFMAFELLRQHGHNVIPVHPKLHEILGVKCVQSINLITEPVDTLTMYVNSEISSGMTQEILKLKPKRVIFNPGTENEALANTLREKNIDVVYACTLVMLKTGQFN